VLFLAPNPPQQSNDNGHYFSGSSSRFYRLLFMSGLMTEDVPKSYGHEVVFGSTRHLLIGDTRGAGKSRLATRMAMI
jgi:hypothetical protein